MRVLLCLALTLYSARIAQSAPLPKPEPGLELRLQITTPKVKPAEMVRCEVTIINRGKQEVTLVQPGDGSDCGWRTPIIEWVINGKVDGARQVLVAEDSKVKGDVPVKKPELQPACLGEGFGKIGRCGNINSLNANEVFVLKPGEQVKLNAWVGNPGSQRGTGTFKVALRYFHIPDLKWKGLGQHDPAAMERIKRSPRVTLESNVVELVVEE